MWVLKHRNSFHFSQKKNTWFLSVHVSIFRAIQILLSTLTKFSLFILVFPYVLVLEEKDFSLQR